MKKAKIVAVNFRKEDEQLLEWTKRYCSENDNSFSRLMRSLLRQFKENEEAKGE